MNTNNEPQNQSLLETQRRIWFRPSPQVKEPIETGHLCTVCNRMLYHVEGNTLNTCQNGHIHDSDFALIQAGV